MNPGTGAAKVLLLVGPEGDFAREELEALSEAGATIVGLGPNRLRVETAAAALLNGCALAWDTLAPARLKESPEHSSEAPAERPEGRSSATGDKAGAETSRETSPESSEAASPEQELAHAA